MTNDFTDIRNHAARLVGLFQERDKMYEEIRRAFHMEWTEKPREDWIKGTLSPTAFNAVIGAVRLLTSTEPHFNVPFDKATMGAKETSEKIEKAAAALWMNSSIATKRPIHYDAVMSAILFAEIDGSVTKTADLLKYAKMSENKTNVSRMTYLANRTPYIFNTYNPSTCYPDMDIFGIRGHLRKTITTWGEVLDTWGSLAEKASGKSSVDRLSSVTLYDWYDWEKRCVWVDGGGDPIYEEEHGLDFFPVVSQITEGTSLFDKPELQRLPMLYAVGKSELWKRESLMLTVIYSLIFSLGSNPLLVRKGNAPGSPIKIDRSIPGGVLDLTPDENIGPLMEKVIDPSQWQGLQIAMDLNEKSTINKQALGAPPNSTGMAFSAISLLSQAGRLPLTGPKQLGGWAIADLVSNALAWIRSDGEKSSVYSRMTGASIEIAPDDIPETITLECILEPDLPQDKLQMANVADALIKNKIASKRWVRENVLNIGQSEAMDKEIWKEDRVAIEVASAMAKLQQAIQLQMQARQAAAMQAQQSQGLQSGAPIGNTPPGGVRPGAPMSGPMPPRGEAPADGQMPGGMG